MPNQSPTKIGISITKPTLLVSVLVGLVVTTVYSLTLMQIISGCGHEYCLDVGEFQLALALWGTVHHTGYPLYMLLGSPFVTLLHGLGIPFVTGASIYSLVWGVLSALGIALIIKRLTANSLLSVGAGLWISVLQSFWVHGSLAEVYSLSMFLTVVSLWLAIDLGEQWSNKKGLGLAFILGLGIAHHRLLILLVPIIGFYLLPIVPRILNFWRWLGLAVLAFVAGFLPYLDMWWRAERNAPWLYSYVNNWENFWFLFLGEEVAGLQKPNFEFQALWQALRDVIRVYVTELSWLGVLLVMAGVILLARQRKCWPNLGLWLGLVAIYSLFAIVLRQAVLLEATVMTALLAFVVLAVLGLNELPLHGRTSAGFVILGLSGFLAYQNYPFIVSLTQNQSNAQYLNRLRELDAPIGAIVMEPWGGQYFAASYAHLVEKEMPHWQFVDHRANFTELADAAVDGRIYTSQDTLFGFNLDWWAHQLGTPLRISSAGPDLIALSAQPLPPAPLETLEIGDGLKLAGWQVQSSTELANQIQVTVYWTAQRVPSRDYSTYVHLSDKDSIQSPDDLIASNDAYRPVYGWYPMTQWQLGELVREDHVITIAPDRVLRTIIIGMYYQDNMGSFIQLGSVHLQKVAEEWVQQP